MAAPLYKRLVLKMSGEILAGSRYAGFDAEVLDTISAEIAGVHDLGVETIIVSGGGNLFRGVSGAERGVERVTGDNMGMIATVINALAIQDRLEHLGKRHHFQQHKSHHHRRQRHRQVNPAKTGCQDSHRKHTHRQPRFAALREIDTPLGQRQATQPLGDIVQPLGIPQQQQDIAGPDRKTGRRTRLHAFDDE